MKGVRVVSSIVQTVVTVLVTAVTSSVITYVITLKKKVKSLMTSQCSQLRIQILDLSTKCLTRGDVTYEELDALTKAYQDYHNLGGNGTITKIYNEVCTLHLNPKNKDTKE